jgi:hypothetical protein
MRGKVNNNNAADVSRLESVCAADDVLVDGDVRRFARRDTLGQHDAKFAGIAKLPDKPTFRFIERGRHAI